MEESKKSNLKRNIKLFFGSIIVIGLLVVSGWYYWNTQQEIENRDVALRSLKYNLKQELDDKRQTQYTEFLRLLMEPLGWAIRTELLSGNISTIHQYLAQFVKNATVELIVVVDADGKIISSSDKKIEGLDFIEAFPDYHYSTDKTQVRTKGTRHYALQPIMGFDEQIGAIFLVYLSADEDWMPASLKNPSS